MTVTYALETNGASPFCRLLFKWKGSLYKLIYRELLVYIAAYFAISCLYRFGLNEDQKALTFLLGFFVSLVASRWWEMYQKIPWTDRFAIHASTYITGDDLRGRMLRRTLIRYLVTGSVICLRDCSSAVRKRFPTMQHIVEAGLLTKEELETIMRPQNVSRYWIPLQWICTLMYKIRSEGRIRSDFLLDRLIQEVMEHRNKLGMLFDHDWIGVPLVYIQVVTIAVYSFFVVCLLGRQYLDPSKKYPYNDIDLYYPWFTTLQFLFYVGWLKVGETLLNPFGEDDYDFELVSFSVTLLFATSYLSLANLSADNARTWPLFVYFCRIISSKEISSISESDAEIILPTASIIEICNTKQLLREASETTEGSSVKRSVSENPLSLHSSSVTGQTGDLQTLGQAQALQSFNRTDNISRSFQSPANARSRFQHQRKQLMEIKTIVQKVRRKISKESHAISSARSEKSWTVNAQPFPQPLEDVYVTKATVINELSVYNGSTTPLDPRTLLNYLHESSEMTKESGNDRVSQRKWSNHPHSELR